MPLLLVTVADVPSREIGSRSRTVALPGDFDRPLPFAVAEEDMTPVADAVSLAAILSLLRDELDTRKPETLRVSVGRGADEDEDEGGETAIAVADARLARLLVLG